MRIGALVPARIGSSRIPRKNIRDLGGKPLLFWTLDVLLEADCLDDVAVSTESDEIAALVRGQYAESQVRIVHRPAALATNSAPMHKVVAHYLENTPDLDYFGVFLPTHPFRKVNIIQEICRQLHTGHLLRVVSVSEQVCGSRDMYYPVENGVKPFFRPPAVFVGHMSACYGFSHRDWQNPAWRRYGYTAHERALRIHISREEDVDIDTEADFALAQAVASGARFQTRKSVLHRVGTKHVLLPEGVNLNQFLDYAGHRLSAPTPPLFLEERLKPSFLYNIGEADPQAYFSSPEAREYYKASPAILKSTNNSDQPHHYVQSPHYRILPAHVPVVGDNIVPPRFHPRNDPAHDRDDVVPWDNIIHMSELRGQPFYVEPVLLSHP